MTSKQQADWPRLKIYWAERRTRAEADVQAFVSRQRAKPLKR